MALWKAKQQGINIVHMVNFINTDTVRTMSHGLQDESIVMQAQALGLPLLQQKVTWDTYEAGFKESMNYLKHRGITGLVTGDIYLLDHRDWIEGVCGESGMQASRPLWNMDPLQLIAEFVQNDFKAVVVNVKADILNKEWVGRQIDNKFIDDLQQVALEKQIDMCGETGEFHTFVYDGPVFNRSIHMGTTSMVRRGDRWFLQIADFNLNEKAQ